MKQNIIWMLEDLISSHQNLKLDFQMDARNSEMKEQRQEIKLMIKIQSDKIKELRDSIKWLKSVK